MARKPKAEHKKKTAVLRFLVTENKKKEIDEYLKRNDKELSEYLRELIDADLQRYIAEKEDKN